MNNQGNLQLDCIHARALDYQITKTPGPERRCDHRSMYNKGSSKPLQIPNVQIMKSVLGLLALASLQNVAAQNSTLSPTPALTETSATLVPFTSLQPSLRPTNSTDSTGTPTFPVPTTSPQSGSPTLTIQFPSSQPSNNETASITRPCSQLLLISEAEEFDEIQLGIYSLQIQSYTDKFGYFVGEPLIVTKCEVVNQSLAEARKRWRDLVVEAFKRLWPWRQATIEGTYLQIEFNIMYSSKYYRYDEISLYPSQFQQYMNDNLEQVTLDYQTRFLPVVEAKDVVVYNTDSPTISPVPTSPPMEAVLTQSPLGEGETLPPTAFKSSAPTFSPAPTISSSPLLPIVDTPKPTRSEIVNDQRSFVVGLAAGLSGAALIVLLFILYTQRTISQRKREGGGETDGSKRSPNGGIEMTRNDNGKAYNATDDQLEDGTSQIAGEVNEVMDVIVSNPSMVSEGGSLGSNPNDIQEGVPVETLQDEFDNYKNQDLEFMRNGVEESVYGAEGMMSLAMTRALMEEEEVNVDWGGAQDCPSMEANIFCEANDWLRKNEKASLERR